MVECYREKRNVDSRQIKFWYFLAMVLSYHGMKLFHDNGFKILIGDLLKQITTTHKKFFLIQSMTRI